MLDSVSGETGVRTEWAIDWMGIGWPRSNPDDPLSSGIPNGSVQVPTSGEPIVLLADRQTVGGYPRIATVISADLPVVGQLTVSHWIEFETCSYETARRALAALEQSLIA